MTYYYITKSTYRKYKNKIPRYPHYSTDVLAICKGENAVRKYFKDHELIDVSVGKTGWIQGRSDYYKKGYAPEYDYWDVWTATSAAEFIDEEN